MTESRFQISDKLSDAILVARGDDPAVVVQDFINLKDAYAQAAGPTQEPVSAAQQMLQRPVNQPGGMGATPVQSSGGDVNPCPNGGRPHQFKSGFSQKTQKNWTAWDCPDFKCLNSQGKNRHFNN